MRVLSVKLFILIVSLLSLSVSGCDQIRRDSYINTHLDLSAEMADNIKKGNAVPGMTKEEATAALGKSKIVDYEENVEIWKYEVPATEGVWVRSIRFVEGKVISVESDLVPTERGHAWDKFTPTDVRIKD